MPICHSALFCIRPAPVAFFPMSTSRTRVAKQRANVAAERAVEAVREVKEAARAIATARLEVLDAAAAEGSAAGIEQALAPLTTAALTGTEAPAPAGTLAPAGTPAVSVPEALEGAAAVAPEGAAAVAPLAAGAACASAGGGGRSGAGAALPVVCFEEHPIPAEPAQLLLQRDLLPQLAEVTEWARSEEWNCRIRGELGRDRPRLTPRERRMRKQVDEYNIKVISDQYDGSQYDASAQPHLSAQAPHVAARAQDGDGETAALLAKTKELAARAAELQRQLRDGEDQQPAVKAGVEEFDGHPVAEEAVAEVAVAEEAVAEEAAAELAAAELAAARSRRVAEDTARARFEAGMDRHAQLSREARSRLARASRGAADVPLSRSRAAAARAHVQRRRAEMREYRWRADPTAPLYAQAERVRPREL